MRALHLKNRSGWWYYYRATPTRYLDVERTRTFCFTLYTQDFATAKVKAAQISKDLDQQWQEALERGSSLTAQDQATRFAASIQVQERLQLTPKPTDTFSDDELLHRLRLLILGDFASGEQKAVLGMTAEPKLSLSDAFDRFWDHIKDEWMKLSHDQQRVKRNIYLKSIRNFEAVIGRKKGLYDIERKDALKFRSWWMDRIEKRGLKPYTGNREMDSLRRLINTNYDIDGVSKPNPMSRVRLKEVPEVARIPLEVEQISALLKADEMREMHQEFQLLFRLLVNTGMRPVEAIGLELEDVILDHEVPHVYIRANALRTLKTAHSERLLPLLGVSLKAAKGLVGQGGWRRHGGKNMYATSVINRQMRASGIVSDKRQSLYSLRHWFQDQLTKRDVVDRAQAQLMGHKFHRPKYGYGKDLSELRGIIAQFAL